MTATLTITAAQQHLPYPARTPACLQGQRQMLPARLAADSGALHPHSAQVAEKVAASAAPLPAMAGQLPAVPAASSASAAVAAAAAVAGIPAWCSSATALIAALSLCRCLLYAAAGPASLQDRWAAAATDTETPATVHQKAHSTPKLIASKLNSYPHKDCRLPQDAPNRSTTTSAYDYWGCS